LQRKLQTKKLASKFIETKLILEFLSEQSTYKDPTRIRIEYSILYPGKYYARTNRLDLGLCGDSELVRLLY